MGSVGELGKRSMGEDELGKMSSNLHQKDRKQEEYSLEGV